MIWLGSVSFHELLVQKGNQRIRAEIFPVDRTGPTVAGFEDEGPLCKEGSFRRWKRQGEVNFQLELR